MTWTWYTAGGIFYFNRRQNCWVTILKWRFLGNKTWQCAPLFSPLHSKLGYLLFLTDSSYSGTTSRWRWGAGGVLRWKLHFPLLKSAKRHKAPYRQSGSTNSVVDCCWSDYADCKDNLFPPWYSRLWLFGVYVCKYEGLLVRSFLCCIDLSHFHSFGPGKGCGCYYAKKAVRCDKREKRRLRKEFVFFESSSQLFQLSYYVKCCRTLLELNSYHNQVQKEDENFVVACLPLP